MKNCKTILFLLSTLLVFSCSDNDTEDETVDKTAKAAVPVSTPSIAGGADTLAALNFYNNGNSKKKAKDFKGAIQDFTKAIEINPKYSSAYNNRGSARGSLSDFKNALADFNKAVEYDTLNVDAFFNRALVKAKLNDVKGSLKDFNRAIILNPANGDYYTKRGIARSLLGDQKGSCLDFAKGAELGNKESAGYREKFCK
jgi:tetratricopeptide (TPR) repeat protein